MSGRIRNRSPSSGTGTVEPDLAWCHAIVGEVSRTFAITIDVLDEPMSSYICVGYLLCRIADTIEDARHIPPEDQSRLLRRYDALLESDDTASIDRFMTAVDPWIPDDDDQSADWAVVTATPRVIRTFRSQPTPVREAIRPPVRELVQGMALFVDRYADEGGLRIQTSDELEEYCYYAAGTVGKLITNLICRDGVTPETRRRLDGSAESFGLLLQLVNIAKDVYVDYRIENNVYLPAKWLRAEGISHESITDADAADRVASVIKRTSEFARDHLDDAQRYLEAVPEHDGNRVEAWAIPFFLAIGTLRELRRRPEDAISLEGIKVSRSEVYAIITAARDVSERESIGKLRHQIATAPYHQ